MIYMSKLTLNVLTTYKSQQYPSPCGKERTSLVVVFDEWTTHSVYSIGFNKPNKTHPIAARFHHKFSSIHSELDAVVKFDGKIKDLHKYVLINVRLDKNGNIRISKPCQCCQYMLAAFGVSEIWYSTNDGNFARF